MRQVVCDSTQAYLRLFIRKAATTPEKELHNGFPADEHGSNSKQKPQHPHMQGTACKPWWGKLRHYVKAALFPPAVQASRYLLYRFPR